MSDDPPAGNGIESAQNVPSPENRMPVPDLITDQDDVGEIAIFPGAAVPIGSKIPKAKRKASTRKKAKAGLRSAFGDVPDLARHTIAFAFATLSIWLLHLLLNYLLGPKATFYDHVPIRYAFDTAHILVFLRFIVQLTREVWRHK